MEKQLLKVAVQVAVIGGGLWLVSRLLGPGDNDCKRKRCQSQTYVPPSRIWFTSPCVGESIENNAQQPQTALYTG